MDAFDFDNVKAEKASAMMRYHRLRTIAKLFRIAEVCLALLLLSWISARLPSALTVSGEYFWKLYALLVSPLFAFFIANAIVLVLLTKSGHFFTTKAIGGDVESEVFKEFIQSGEDLISFQSDSHQLLPEAEEIVYQDKEILSEVISIKLKQAEKITVPSDSESKVYRKSRSEILKRQSVDKPSGKLRRSETEKCAKTPVEEPAEIFSSEDDISMDEFRRTVEAFIEKQTRFHRQESLAVVPHNLS